MAFGDVSKALFHELAEYNKTLISKLIRINE